MLKYDEKNEISLSYQPGLVGETSNTRCRSSRFLVDRNRISRCNTPLESIPIPLPFPRRVMTGQYLITNIDTCPGTFKEFSFAPLRGLHPRSSGQAAHRPWRIKRNFTREASLGIQHSKHDLDVPPYAQQLIQDKPPKFHSSDRSTMTTDSHGDNSRCNTDA